jgi:hypothetical protein
VGEVRVTVNIDRYGAATIFMANLQAASPLRNASITRECCSHDYGDTSVSSHRGYELLVSVDSDALPSAIRQQFSYKRD